MVTGIVVLHAALLAYCSWTYSPTIDEPAHLASGIDHWRTGEFRAYCVNPHFPRMIAALPVLLLASEEQLNGVPPRSETISRPEFLMGRDLVDAWGPDIFPLMTLARLGCLVFSIMGGLGCYLWAKWLYGQSAGYVALCLWCFLPEVLGHGALVTADVPAAAAGAWAGWTFCMYLKDRTWQNALRAGLAMGLALLTKSTWIVLFAIWPLLWGASFCYGMERHPRRNWKRELSEIIILLATGWFLLNLGYGFQGTFQRLGDYRFDSAALSGETGPRWKPRSGHGNRFHHSPLRHLPVPLPRDYLLGIDLQKRDFEHWRPTYLAGDVHPDGVWYFYLYAGIVKLPLGFLILLGVRLLMWTLPAATVHSSDADVPRGAKRITPGRAPPQGTHRTPCELVLIVVPTVLLVIASSMGSLAYFRYLMPIWPFLIVWISSLARPAGRKPALARCVVLLPLGWMIGSSLWTYPHSLSYFNEAAGGPRNGHEHLIDSHLDWGQDLLLLKAWYDRHPQVTRLYLAYRGPVNPHHAGIDFELPPTTSAGTNPEDSGPPPGWYAISIHLLCGGSGWIKDDHGERLYISDRRFTSWLEQTPYDRVGRTIVLFRHESVPTP
jgi:hypothetical protein